jgi:hypothetical protein
MSDLKVKTQLLRDTATSLAELRSELDGLDRRRDRVRSAWGSEDVAGALDEFVDSMASLKNMAQATADEFEGIEASLSASFDR